MCPGTDVVACSGRVLYDRAAIHAKDIPCPQIFISSAAFRATTRRRCSRRSARRAAGVTTNAKDVEAVRELIRALTASSGAPVDEAKGLDPAWQGGSHQA
jgi:hypothetical protein